MLAWLTSTTHVAIMLTLAAYQPRFTCNNAPDGCYYNPSNRSADAGGRGPMVVADRLTHSIARQRTPIALLLGPANGPPLGVPLYLAAPTDRIAATAAFLAELARPRPCWIVALTLVLAGCWARQWVTPLMSAGTQSR